MPVIAYVVIALIVLKAGLWGFTIWLITKDPLGRWKA